MGRLILRRLAATVPVLLLVTAGVFALIHLTPGDPIDAMVVSDFSTYPGVVIPSRALGLIRLEQNAKTGKGRQRNDRIVAEPVPTHRSVGVLSERVRKELEKFFFAATLFEGKDIEILGWGSADEAEALIDEARRRA